MKTLLTLSRGLIRLEIAVGGTLVAVIFLLLLANAVSRAIGAPLIWTDELAVHAMVWLAFIGASVAIATRGHMAIGLLPDTLSARARAMLAVLTDGLVLLFTLAIALIVWRWLDVPGLIHAGSGAALAQETFNFIYTDPTLTMGLRKIWFWLILPLTAVTSILHAMAIVAADIAILRAAR